MKQPKTITIPVDRLELLKFSGYFRIYYEEYYPRPEFEGRHLLAYRAIEADYFQLFRVHKYTSYDSFRRSKSAYLEKTKVDKKLN
jgi:hypothetical protein